MCTLFRKTEKIRGGETNKNSSENSIIPASKLFIYAISPHTHKDVPLTVARFPVVFFRDPVLIVSPSRCLCLMAPKPSLPRPHTPPPAPPPSRRVI